MKRAAALLLIGVLILGQPFSAMGVQAQEAAEKSQTRDNAEDSREDKTETVYVKADAEGNVQEISVETVLKNRNNGESLPDYSKLSDIKNMEGDEEFTQNEDGSILWENHGEDISYKGKSSESLPVSVKVSYYLDGEAITPDALAGKSGTVRIRFDYENHTSQRVTVNGRNMEVQTPFVLMSMLFLPSDTFSNIRVTNGKVMTGGDDQIVIGYTSPGLSDSLKLESYGPTEDVSVPDYVEVTADVSEFELGFTATVVTPGFFADMDTENLEDGDELISDMGKLTDASGQLVSGTSGYLTGIKTFQAYMGEYVKGVGAVSEGSDTLASGLAVLNENKEAVQDGAETLQSGLENLNGALAQITVPSFEGMDDTAFAEAAETLAADGEQLAVCLASAQESIVQMQTFMKNVSAYAETVQNNVSAARNELASAKPGDVEAAADAMAKEQAGSAVDAALAAIPEDKLSAEEKNAIRDAVVNGINISGISSGAENHILAAETQLAAIPDFEASELSLDVSTIETLVGDMSANLEILQSYSESLSGIGDTFSEMGSLLETLKSSVSQLESGSRQLTEGIIAFNDGVSKLYEGASALNTGVSELTTAGETLNDGVETLVQGAGALNDGVTAFDEEGVQSLDDLAGGDLENLLTRIRALKEADSRYNNFGGIREDQTGSVKFIIETAEIEK
ncbi:hypothetical protein [Frisingicoccus sp.]|uniref:hypothetical protein n=1 Tax=Frisingicoccus sp. TaxID=1918627 RepID=UPI003AB71A71